MIGLLIFVFKIKNFQISYLHKKNKTRELNTRSKIKNILNELLGPTVSNFDERLQRFGCKICTFFRTYFYDKDYTL